MPLCSYSTLATRAQEVVTQSQTPGIGRAARLASGGPRIWHQEKAREPRKRPRKENFLQQKRGACSLQIFFFFALKYSMQDLCSLTRNWTHVPCIVNGLPGKSLSDYVISSKVKVSRKDSLWLTWQQKSEPAVIHGCDFLTQCCGCGHCSRITSSLLWRCQRNGQQVNWLSQKDHYDSGQQSLWSF